MGFDGQSFVWYGVNILNGHIPYRDFFEFKPPVIMWLNAFGILCFGYDGYSFRWLPFILISVSFCMFYAALRKMSVSRLFVFLVTLSVVYLVFTPSFHDGTLNDSESCGLAFTLMSFSMIHWNRSAVTLSCLFTKSLGGVLAGVAIMSKEPFLLVVVPMIFVNVCYEQGISLRIKIYGFSSVCIGGMLFIWLVGAYLFSNSALIAYMEAVQAGFLYSGNYARDLGLFNANTILEALQFDASKLFWGYFYGACFIGLLPFCFAFIVLCRSYVLRVGVICSIIAGFLAVSLGHCFWNHYFLMGIMGMVLPAVYGALLLDSDCGKRYSGWKHAVTAFAVLLGAFLFFSRLSSAYAAPVVDFRFQVPIDLKNAVEKYSRPGDHILVVSNTPLYFVELKRESACRWGTLMDEIIRFYPGLTLESKIECMKREIGENCPKVIFIERTFLFTRQEKIISSVVVPLIEKLEYSSVAPGIFIRPNLIDLWGN